jgi:hypothetical protein
MATELRPFIVAEISKNWIDGNGVVDDTPIAVLFERVIETNTRRGYRLQSFHLHRLMVKPSEMNETIIAVFARAKRQP